MPQAIQVETQAEQQSLERLHAERASGGASRELTLRRGENADQSPPPIDAARKGSPHFSAHSPQAPRLLTALSRDDTPGAELAPNISMIALAVEFGIGQHQPDRVCSEAVARPHSASSRGRSRDPVAPFAPIRTAGPSRPPRST